MKSLGSPAITFDLTAFSGIMKYASPLSPLPISIVAASLSFSLVLCEEDDPFELDTPCCSFDIVLPTRFSLKISLIIPNTEYPVDAAFFTLALRSENDQPFTFLLYMFSILFFLALMYFSFSSGIASSSSGISIFI